MAGPYIGLHHAGGIVTSVDSLTSELPCIVLCIIHQDQARMDQVAQMKAQMDAVMAAHVRGLLPDVPPPYLIDRCSDTQSLLGK